MVTQRQGKVQYITLVSQSVHLRNTTLRSTDIIKMPCELQTTGCVCVYARISIYNLNFYNVQTA